MWCDFVCFEIKTEKKSVMCSELKHTEWTSEQDEILIDYVRNHESLYNVQCKDYRKTQLKQILQITDNECSKRWGYVRDYYIKRRGKPGTGSSGEAVKKRSKQLSFLDSISSDKRSTLSNIEQLKSQESMENSTAHCSKKDKNIEQQQYELLTADDTSGNITNIQEAGAGIKKTSKIIKRKSTTASVPTDERLKILKQIAERQEQKDMEKQDENDLFFGSMAKITKKLPQLVQARLRMQIGNLVGNAEVEHLSPLPSPDYGRASSADSSTSYNTFVSEDSLITPIEATLVTAEPTRKGIF